MTLFLKRAIRDILSNRLLNAITVIIISLSIIIVSAFVLVVVNTNDLISVWKKGIRIMVYLRPAIPDECLQNIKQEIEKMQGVRNVRFISKEQALGLLKEEMKRHASLLDDLSENPLPDALEIQINPSSRNREEIETLATQIESMSWIDEVEYGRRWLGRLANIINLFKLAGYAMGVLFFMAAVFIVANTIRLLLYSRREEIEIMRLVGATDRFIKVPFYIEGLIQGGLGGIIGIFALFSIFMFICSNIAQGPSFAFFHIRFLPIDVVSGIVIGSMFVGWFGCYLSLKQFLKN
jgi:cell division transport system permease protein